jgi:hypothetical protein
MNPTQDTEAKYATVVSVIYTCGCGFRATAATIVGAAESLAAWEHARKTGHTVTIHGEVRAEHEKPVGRPVYRTSTGGL